MSKFILLEKEVRSNKFHVNFSSTWEDDIDELINVFGGYLGKEKFMKIEVSDDIDEDYISEGRLLNRHILESYLKNKDIDPMSFLEAFVLLSEMGKEEQSRWLKEKKIEFGE